jgi:hypothetical protein
VIPLHHFSLIFVSQLCILVSSRLVSSLLTSSPLLCSHSHGPRGRRGDKTGDSRRNDKGDKIGNKGVEQAVSGVNMGEGPSPSERVYTDNDYMVLTHSTFQLSAVYFSS